MLVAQILSTCGPYERLRRMGVKSEEQRASGPPTGEVNREACVQRPVLNTDVFDFFAIGGWRAYTRSPLYENADRALRKEIRLRYKAHMATIQRGEKVAQGRFCRSLVAPYYEGEFKMLGDLKSIIESEGLAFYTMGPKGFDLFSEALKEYGLEPIVLGKLVTWDRKLYRPGASGKR